MAIFLRIAEQALLYFPLVCGGYLSFSLLRIPNFSSEGAFVFGAYTATVITDAMPMVHPVPLLLLSMLAAMFGGILIGLCMGLIATVGNIPYLLSSIITLGICHGLHTYVLNGSLVSLHGHNVLAVGALVPAHPEFIALCCIGAVLLLLFIPFLSTQLGICLAAYGGNPAFFKHHGIATNYVVVMGICLTNALAGLSGFFVAQSSGFIDMNAGSGLSLLCITALMLGKLCMRLVPSGSRGMLVFIPLFGIMLYCCLQQLLLVVGLNLKYFTVLQALIVLCSLVYARAGNTVQNVHSDHLGV